MTDQTEDHHQLRSRQSSFWQALKQFRQKANIEELKISSEVFEGIRDLTPKEKLDKIGQPSLVLGLELLIFRSWQAKRATY